MALLTGKALTWATAVWESGSSICRDADLFCREMRKVFDHLVSGYQAATRLLQFHRGSRSVADYAIEFRSLAAKSNWTLEALITSFYHGLSESLKDELAAREDVQDLATLISLAIHRLRERRRNREPAHSSDGASTHATAPTAEESIQLACARLSQAWRWIPAKSGALRTGQLPPRSRKCSSFWVLQTYTGVLIWNFGAIALALTDLTRKSTHPFRWTPQANVAFKLLKSRFTTDPVLSG